MRQYDHIRTHHIDINDAVGDALSILNNKRRKNNTVTFEDIQLARTGDDSGVYYVVIIYSYDDPQPEQAQEARPQWIGAATPERVRQDAGLHKRFIAPDHSDD